MKVFMVLCTSRIDDDETTADTFKKWYPSKEVALQEVEAHALELWNGYIDPNDGDEHRFPGLVHVGDTHTLELDGGSEEFEIIELMPHQ